MSGSKYQKPLSEQEVAERREELAGWRKEAAMELDVMSKCFEHLSPLSRESQGRALRWLEARLDNRPYYGEPPF